VKNADIVILGVKPQNVDAVLKYSHNTYMCTFIHETCMCT
jgi:pyrroline-5-carboxylate reductase